MHGILCILTVWPCQRAKAAVKANVMPLNHRADSQAGLMSSCSMHQSLGNVLQGLKEGYCFHTHWAHPLPPL